MKKLFLLVSIALIGLIASGSVQANLLINGSFEEPIVTGNSGQWELFSESEVDGWFSGDDIEIQTYLLFGPAADGSQYVELDSNGSDGNGWLSQMFNTMADQEYIFSFAYSPRPGVENNDLEVGIMSGLSFLTLDYLNSNGSGLSETNWDYYSYSFVGNGANAQVLFRDSGPDDGLGVFIDDVSVNPVNPVPEPSTIVLMGLGLVGLAGYGRKRMKR